MENAWSGRVLSQVCPKPAKFFPVGFWPLLLPPSCMAIKRGTESISLPNTTNVNMNCRQNFQVHNVVFLVTLIHAKDFAWIPSFWYLSFLFINTKTPQQWGMDLINTKVSIALIYSTIFTNSYNQPNKHRIEGWDYLTVGAGDEVSEPEGWEMATALHKQRKLLWWLRLRIEAEIGEQHLLKIEHI